MKIKAYTDGACSGNPGPGGWAYVLCEDAKCYAGSGGCRDTTNNRMELFAVIRLLERIRNDTLYVNNHNEYEIISDSAYVINAINNKWFVKWYLSGWITSKGNDVKNRDLWETFIKLENTLTFEGIKLKFTKVKGHAGNYFNELVDKLAKEEINKLEL